MKNIFIFIAVLLLSSSFAFADEGVQNNNAVKPLPSNATQLADDDSHTTNHQTTHHKHHYKHHHHHHQQSSEHQDNDHS